jgi:tetratricopeptide (TPR) repeat protein
MIIVAALLVSLIPSISFAHPDTVLSHRDSVREHYLKHGAWRVNYFSREYGKYIDSAIAESHDDAYLWEQRGMPYWKRMKYEIAEAYTDSAVKYDTMMWLDYRGFCKCIFAKKYRSAIQDFRAAQRLHPDSGVMDHYYNFYLGLCHMQLDQLDSAESLFRNCIARDEKAGVGWVHYLHRFYLGIALYEQGRYESAIEQFDSALEKYPRFSDAKYYKASCYDKLNQHGRVLPLLLEAQRDLKDGLTINEDNAIYEQYPYQIRRANVDGWVASLEKEATK